ncbi:fimbrial protein [Pseudomonas sp. MWU13-2105]|uniref:fimbrial protein n=1 Tax=Pseudomonas sp. MWU13-2105 TaxID=2935074 RepID=UPI00200FF8EB|nr:fimbrial protein [Pseudomonas sp. MWU13-2105]
MKTSLIALSLGLAASLAGTAAFANTGMINFEGKITSSTCPIEVVNPEDGAIGNQVKMGSVDASRFTAPGQEYRGKSFVLRVKDSATCGGTANTAEVTFNGVADSSGNYFSVGPDNDTSVAKGVAIVIRDKTGDSIAPGDTSAEYDLNATGPTDMLFNAYYRRTAPATGSVQPGSASADVLFVVAVN